MVAYTLQKVDLSNARQVQTFLRLPYNNYYRNIPSGYPLQTDAARMLYTRKKPFYAHSTISPWL
jgi:hypothetical protein